LSSCCQKHWLHFTDPPWGFLGTLSAYLLAHKGQSWCSSLTYYDGRTLNYQRSKVICSFICLFGELERQKERGRKGEKERGREIYFKNWLMILGAGKLKSAGQAGMPERQERLVLLLSQKSVWRQKTKWAEICVFSSFFFLQTHSCNYLYVILFAVISPRLLNQNHFHIIIIH
jgi:hypothetical protein